MRYIISESRLHEFINQYLETFLESRAVSQFDSFIVVSEKISPEDDEWVDYMEYDSSDGRLWINQSFLKGFVDLFAFTDGESAQEFIKTWFEKKFGVKIKYCQS